MKSNGQVHIDFTCKYVSFIFPFQTLITKPIYIGNHNMYFYIFLKSRYNSIFVNVICRGNVTLQIRVNGYHGRVLRKRTKSEMSNSSINQEKCRSLLIFFFLSFFQLTKANKSKKISFTSLIARQKK